MARKPRGANAEKEQELEILKALRFVSVAQQDTGTPYQTHCRFTETHVVAFDGVLAAGYPLNQPITACPHTRRLIDALSRVRGAFSVAMISRSELVIQTDKFRAVVPCLGEEVSRIEPQPNTYKLDKRWIEAADTAGLFIREGAMSVIETAVLTDRYTVIGTDKKVFIECATFNEFPPGLIIPWAAIKALKKIEAELVGFGYDGNSITFWFADNSWLRTQLYLDQFPRLDRIQNELNRINCTVSPNDYERAIAAVLPFCDEKGGVILDGTLCYTHDAETRSGASHTIPPLPIKRIINASQFVKVAPIMTAIDFTTLDTMVAFVGNNLRGCMTVYG